MFFLFQQYGFQQGVFLDAIPVHIMHAFFYKKHFYQQCQTENVKKSSKCFEKP